jgi:hypothetical protein
MSEKAKQSRTEPSLETVAKEAEVLLASLPTPKADLPVLPAASPGPSGAPAFDQLSRMEDKLSRIEEKSARQEAMLNRTQDGLERAAARVEAAAKSVDAAELAAEVAALRARIEKIPGFPALLMGAGVTALVTVALFILLVVLFPGLVK